MKVETPGVAQIRQRIGRKWRRYPVDVIPTWIADMDFLPAPSIRATLQEAVDLGDLGYGPTAADSGVPQAFSAWAERRWGWTLDPAHVLLMPDVISGLFNCIEALTQPGDAVLVQTPIYAPFLSTIRALGRRLVEVPLDEPLEATVAREQVRMILFCNPHNPTGHVFDRAELDDLARIARAHDVIVVSDEVHADLVFDGARHMPFAPLAEEHTVTLNSPSKAFNVAGLRLAVCAVANPDLRSRLTALPANRWTPFGALGVRAALAAWSDEGETWLDACVAQLKANRDRISDRLPKGVRYAPPQAGYLAWLDFRLLNLPTEPAAYLLEHARIALSPGEEFGSPGIGHARLNFATSEAVLDEILARMGEALG
jgi:cystathionine beta-lyase